MTEFVRVAGEGGAMSAAAAQTQSGVHRLLEPRHLEALWLTAIQVHAPAICLCAHRTLAHGAAAPKAYTIKVPHPSAVAPTVAEAEGGEGTESAPTVENVDGGEGNGSGSTLDVLLEVEELD